MSNINELVTEIKQATDYQINKKILREKIQTDLHVAFNGGLFKVSPELLAFVATYRYTTMYLEDTYGNPVEIDRDAFRTLCEEHYQQVMNTWHQQHAELKKIRKI
jgi:hypothetical protein